jgi:hypothetical protein
MYQKLLSIRHVSPITTRASAATLP